MNQSPQQAVIEILKRDKSTDDILAWMTQNGQSLTLNWGEDNELWECCWIPDGGKRYTSFGTTARRGSRECIKALAQEELGMNPFQFNSLEDY